MSVETDLSNKDLGKLAEVSGDSPGRRIDHAIEIAREILGMDFGYVSEFVGGEQILRATSGDGESFEMTEGDGYPLDGTYCQRMVTGQIPKLIPDTSENDKVRELALTRLSAIGSYVGVPIYLSEGRLFGTFCTISHNPAHQLGERHLRVMEVLSHIVATGIEQQRLEKEVERLRAQITNMTTELDDAEGDRRLSRIMMSGEFQAIPRGALPPE